MSRTGSCLRRHPRGAVLLTVMGGLTAAFVTSSPQTRPLLENTLLLALAAIVISLPLGTVLAWLAYRTDAPGARGSACCW